jgi:RNA polymerase sigma factor (sigma-70 family)
MSNRWQATRRAPTEVLLGDLDAMGPAVDTGANAERALLDRLGATPEISQALDALPETYRAAVLLVDVEELTYEEASAALGCPVGTVRSRLARGRRQLCASLTSYATKLGVVRSPTA